MSGLRWATAATMDGALVFGMALALLARLKEMARHDRTFWDAKLPALNLALPPLVLLGGVVLDIYGARSVLVAGSALLAVGLVGLSVRRTYPQAVVALLLAALGASAVGAASTVLMPRAFFTARETTASLNLGYVFVALGAGLTTLLADILRQKMESRRVLAVFALLALTPAFLAVLPSGEAWPSRDSAAAAPNVWSESVVWLAALVLLFYAPLEAAISLWTFTLLAEREQDEREARNLLIGFWTAFLASRLCLAVAQHLDFLTEGWDRLWIAATPLLAAVLLGNLAGASHRGRPRAGFLLLGLLLGPLLPTLLALLLRHVAPNEQGLAFGLIFAAGSAGSAALTPILTPRTQPPLQSALRLPIFLALLVSAAALVMGLMTQ
jgi:MFS family permease